ncbi:MAG: hypothetical protein ACK5WS_02450 [Alphaproteobacteria bacterium]|jgi:hypothetical protein|nr:hypothetical protein [Candidatus Jidaibacter sp.]
MKLHNKLFSRQRSSEESQQLETEICINYQADKSEVRKQLKAFAKSNSVISLSIIHHTLSPKQFKLVCIGIQNNPHISSISLSHLDTLKQGQIDALIISLVSCHNIKKLSLDGLLTKNITSLTTILLSNPYISEISASFISVRATNQHEISLAKSLLSCKYLTSIHTNLSLTSKGLKAFELSHQYNQNIISIRSQSIKSLGFIRVRQTALQRYMKKWIQFKNGHKINCDINTLYNYAYNHYPAFKKTLSKYDNINATQFAKSLFSDIQPSSQNMLCTRNLSGVCLLFSDLINKTAFHNSNTKIESALLRLPEEILDYIIQIAQKDIVWRRKTTEEEFDQKLENSI